MSELADYLYIDERQLGRLMQQIEPRREGTRHTLGASLNLPGFGAKYEMTRETGTLTGHAAVQKLMSHLRDTSQLWGARPDTIVDLWDDINQRRIRYVHEEMTATKVLFTASQVKRADNVAGMIVWVSEPPDPLPPYATLDHQLRLRESLVEGASRYRVPPPVPDSHREPIHGLDTPYGLHKGGTFLYLLQCHWTESAPIGLGSPCSALQLIANAKKEASDLFRSTVDERFGRGSHSHPLSKLESIGGRVMGTRRIASLYLVRYFSDEQCFRRDGVRYRVNDMIGYPIFIQGL